MNNSSQDKRDSQDQRKAWATPRLTRIEAGSAESRAPSGKNDGGGSAVNNRS